jgi:DMSO reductase family type II enzyme chaperone
MNMTVHEHDLTAARVRSNVYRLLADGFSQVDGKLFESFKSGYASIWRELAGLIEGGEEFPPFIEQLEKIIDSIDYEGLVAEHSRLFEPRSKLQVPPYETEYTLAESPQHALSQPAHLSDIAGFYKAFGLAISEERPDRVDHIATELEFMHVLALKESKAIEGNETEHIEIVRDAQLKFMNDHLGRWTGQFRDRMADADEDGFYIVLAEMLDVWINLDKTYLFS